MTRRETFQGGTREEAEVLADSRIKSDPGCRVIDSRATAGGWRLVLEYEDKPKPA
jgi:hypothetical protein